MKITAIVLILSFWALVSCGEENNAAQMVDQETFTEKMNGDFQLLDVRTEEELEETGVIGDPRHLDLSNDRFREEVTQLDQDEPVLLYCRTDNRSGQAAHFLAEEGYEEVYYLEGGIVDWQNEGRETEESE